LTAFASRLADLAQAMSLKYFRQPLDVERKADLSPVTEADRAIETAMRAEISVTYPRHGIFGEEHGSTNLQNDNIWVIDPIDGTKSFITGMPTFGTLIAHLENGYPSLGIISIPATAERWIGHAGEATLFENKVCRTSGCSTLSAAMIYATSPDNFDAKGLQVFDRISARAAMRRFGGDCYCYGLLASGHVDAVIEMNLQPYDYMALIPIVQGAGGVMSDWEGAPLHLASDGKVVAAATPELHAEILDVIRG